jgi:hypothetical protein
LRRLKVSRAQLRPHQLRSKAGVAVGVCLAQSFVELAAVVEAFAVVIVFRTPMQNRPHNGDEMRVLVQQGGGRRLHASTQTVTYVVACGGVHSWPMSARTSSKGSPVEERRAEDHFVFGIDLSLVYSSHGLGTVIAVLVQMAVETRQVVIDDVDPFEQWAALASAVGVAHEFEHSCE